MSENACAWQGVTGARTARNTWGGASGETAHARAPCFAGFGLVGCNSKPGWWRSIKVHPAGRTSAMPWQDGPGGVVWNAEDIAAAAEGRLIQGGTSGSICTDTRKLVAGDWFLALKGKNFDGHDWIANAHSHGCSGLVANTSPAGWDRGFVQVKGDTLLALQRLGSSVRNRFSKPVVGITGSVGKTTSRAMTALALSPLGHVHQTEGNLNNHIGLPLTLLRMPHHSAACVLELGMSQSGEILNLAKIARPNIRVVLNVGPAHLENFSSLEDVAAAKGEIFSGAGAEDICVLNADDPLVMALPLPKGVQRVLFGRTVGCHVRLVSSTVTKGGFASTVLLEQRRLSFNPEHYEWDSSAGNPVSRVQFEISSPGTHLGINACAAAAIAISLGVPLADAVASISSKYTPVGMRTRLETESRTEKDLLIINDAYNANPMSMASALRTLQSIDLPCSTGRRIAILGDMLELGEDHSHAAHLEIVQLALQEVKVDVLCLVGRAFQTAAGFLDLHQPMMRSNRSCEVVVRESSREFADQVVQRLVGPGDVILVKGSRELQMEVVVEALKNAASSTALN